MGIEEKIIYFDYLITSVIKKCYRNSNSDNEAEVIRESCSKSNLSKLKLMKILFFVTTLNVKEWYLLDNVFNNFYAMPYGPVESDVYDNLDRLINYTISGNQLLVREDAKFDYSLQQEITSVIDDSIDKLKDINPSIFNMGAFELVELSHKADSWRITFNEAQTLGSLSRKIPAEVIKMSKVYYK